MDKKKSHKKINKTISLLPRRQQSPKIPVQTIMKQIGELKKQLVSIKSKKYLHLSERQDNHKNQISTQKSQIPINEELVVPATKLKHNLEETKQNTKQCECKHNTSASKRENLNKRKQIKIQFFPITAPKSRQTKLKFNIQLNKIKSTLQKISLETDHTQSVQVIVSQLNSTMIYINSIIKQYEDEIVGKRQQFKQMKEQLAELSKRIIKLGEKHSNQRQLGEVQVEQIAELKRHLSYYMSLMKDNKEEAEKYSKEFTDLQAYVKQLENSNQLMRAEIKRIEQKYTQTSNNLKQIQSSNQNLIKQMALLESDIHITKTQSDKNREKRREIQKLNQKLSEQLEQIKNKLNNKQRMINKVDEQKKELEKIIQSLKYEQKNMVIGMTNKKIQIQKLQKQNTILDLTLQQKQRTQAQKDQQIHQLKQKLETELKQNKKNITNLQFCQLEINNLSQQIDQLRRANERYKNQHFRNKLIHPQHESDTGRVQVTDRSTKMNIKSKLFEEETALKNQSKNRKKMLGEIQELIQKHRKSSDSESESEQN